MIQNNENGENKDINFNILTDVKSNNNKCEYSFENFIIIFDIQNGKLMIEIQNKTNSDKYQKQYTQNELIAMNKVFSMFDSVEDCINIIEVNKNNFSISTENDICIFTIKLDTQELPKNKISDKIIFQIPLMKLKIEKNNSNMSLINKNLRCLKIESTFSMESNNNVSPHNSNTTNINLENINNIVQNLVTKIDNLSQENKEMKERLKVLEENNNKLIDIMKENRIQLLKEKSNLENSYCINKKENNNKIFFDGYLDLDNSSFSLQNDTSPENQNYLTKIYSNFLKNKTKNNSNIENGLINKKSRKASKDNKEKISLSLNDKEADNYFYSEKFDVNIIDDVGLFKNEETKKGKESKERNKYNKEYYNNIMNLDEEEEEKKNILRKKEEDETWLVNNSYNMVGGVCLNEGNQDININKESNPNRLNVIKEENSNEDGYLY